MDFRDLIEEDLCFSGVEAQNWEEVLIWLTDKLRKKGYVKESFAQAILQREKEFATGLPLAGYKVAIPHTYPEHVHKSVIAVAALRYPVAFGEMGTGDASLDVHIVCMLVIKDNAVQAPLLGTLIHFLSKSDAVLEKIAQATAGEQIAKIIKQST